MGATEAQGRVRGETGMAGKEAQAGGMKKELTLFHKTFSNT